MILILIITLSFVGIVAISLLLSVIFSDKRMSAQARLLAGRASSAVPDVVSINISSQKYHINMLCQNIISKYLFLSHKNLLSKYQINLLFQNIISKFVLKNHIRILYQHIYDTIMMCA